MRILTLNFNLKGIGTYRRSYYFSRELARAGHDVTMFTVSRDARFRGRSYYKSEWTAESPSRGCGAVVKVIETPNLGYKWLPGWGSGPLDIAARIVELLGGRYDAVFGFEHHPNVSWPVYTTRPLLRFRYISDWCDWFAGSSNSFRGWKMAHAVDEFLENRIRQKADLVTVTSSALWERALSIRIPIERLARIPEGAATDYIAPVDRRAARTKFDLPASVHIVAAVTDGGIGRTLRIFREVARHDRAAALLVIGRMPSKAFAFAQSLGVGERVLRAGWVSDEDYPLYLGATDVCICPLHDSVNDQARWPAKILDYLSAGRAVVTNDVGEAGALLRRQRAGALAPHDDRGFAETILNLLFDPAGAEAMGATARALMVQQWDWRHRGAAIEAAAAGTLSKTASQTRGAA